MITRLQTIFLKHNKWLFGGLLVVIIVTFVLTIGPQSFFGGSGPQQHRALNYYGYDLSSEADQRTIALGAEISAILHPQLGIRNEQLTDYAYMRVAAMGIANQIGVPAPSKEALSGFIETLGVFQNPQTGEFSAEAYNQMMNALQTSSRYSKEAVGQVMREDYRIQMVREALSGPDYTLPFELKQDFIDRQTNYTIKLAHFDYEGFEPSIDASDEDLEQFFKENPARYEIPETLSVSILNFSGEAYLEEIPDPSAEALEAYFTANKASYEPEESDAETATESEEAEKPEVSLADVRETVLKDWKLVQATDLAARKSEAFSVTLWKESIALGSPEYNALLEEYKVQSKDLPPYSRNLPPSLSTANAQLLNSMWVYANSPTRYFSDISPTPSGAELLVCRGLTEARMPEFSEVKDQVTLVYLESEKRRLFSEQGAEMRETIQSRLESESFEDIAGSLSLEVESLEPFNGTNLPQSMLSSSIWDQTRYLDNGQVSPLALQGTRGTYAYMVEKVIPELDQESADYQDYIAQRSGALSESMGWSRLREITDQSLEAVVGSPVLN